MAEQPNGTRLPYAAYLDHLRSDGTRLAELATDLAAPVPSCPGWTVRDLVEHTADVYVHKTGAVRDRRMPHWPPEHGDADPVERLRTALSELLTVLEAAQPDTPAVSWWPTEQSAGFWARRMAHESVIHRIDAELAADLPSLVDESLGVDGTDEVLTRFLTDPRLEWPVVEAPPCTVLVRVEAGPGWLVRLEPDAVHVDLHDAGSEASVDAGTEAVLAGTGADLDLWLWGRGDLDVLRAEGSASAIALLSERMVTATQ